MGPRASVPSEDPVQPAHLFSLLRVFVIYLFIYLFIYLSYVSPWIHRILNRTEKALIRLRRWVSWFQSSLASDALKHIFSWPAHINYKLHLRLFLFFFCPPVTMSLYMNKWYMFPAYHSSNDAAKQRRVNILWYLQNYSKIPILRPPLGLSKSGLKDHFWTVPNVVSNQRYTGCRKWRNK